MSNYQPDRIESIKQAIHAVFSNQDINSYMSPIRVSEEGENYTLSSQTDPEMPVIISSAYRWLPEISQQLQNAVEEANGRPCIVEFDGVDADEDEDEEEVDDDE
ncbi:hypothetical protein ACO0LN_25840 [Undibacterium sp. TC9W]